MWKEWALQRRRAGLATDPPAFSSWSCKGPTAISAPCQGFIVYITEIIEIINLWFEHQANYKLKVIFEYWLPFCAAYEGTLRERDEMVHCWFLCKSVILRFVLESQVLTLIIWADLLGINVRNFLLIPSFHWFHDKYSFKVYVAW